MEAGQEAGKEPTRRLMVHVLLAVCAISTCEGVRHNYRSLFP